MCRKIAVLRDGTEVSIEFGNKSIRLSKRLPDNNGSRGLFLPGFDPSELILTDDEGLVELLKDAFNSLIGHEMTTVEVVSRSRRGIGKWSIENNLKPHEVYSECMIAASEYDQREAWTKSELDKFMRG